MMKHRIKTPEEREARAVLEDIELEYKVEGSKSKEEFIIYLQGAALDIDSAIIDLEYAAENRRMINRELRMLAELHAKLTFQLIIIENELLEKDSKRDLEIESRVNLAILEFSQKKVLEKPLKESLKYFQEVSYKILESMKKKEFRGNFNNFRGFKKYNWFKIGLLFAEGKPQSLYDTYKNEKGCFRIVTEKLGLNSKRRTYISSTISEIQNNNNIYTYKRMSKIIQHHKENNIQVDKGFLDKYNDIKQENT